MKAEDGTGNSASCLRAMSDYRHGEWDYLRKKINLATLNINIRNCDSFYNKHSTVTSLLNVSAPYLNCIFKIENQDEVIKLERQTRRSLK
jgi:hypothetical protein